MAELCNLKVTVIIQDPEKNILQEFVSDWGFTVDEIVKMKEEMKHLKLDADDWKNMERKNYPQTNFTE